MVYTSGGVGSTKSSQPPGGSGDDRFKKQYNESAFRFAFSQKLEAFVKLTAEYTPETLLVLHDAVDVLMMRGDANLVKTRYLAITKGKSKVVLSTEKHVLHKPCKDGYEPLLYPNTGLWIGPAGLLHHIFRYMNDVRVYLLGNEQRAYDDWVVNDQKLFMCMYPRVAEWQSMIMLDKRSEIFQTMFDGTRPMVGINHEVIGWDPTDREVGILWSSDKSSYPYRTYIGQWEKYFQNPRNAKFNTEPLFFHFNVIREYILTAYKVPTWRPPISVDDLHQRTFHLSSSVVSLKDFCCSDPILARAGRYNKLFCKKLKA
jgi:hypothetical protein